MSVNRQTLPVESRDQEGAKNGHNVWTASYLQVLQVLGVMQV
jgi:hypothetical protein